MDDEERKAWSLLLRLTAAREEGGPCPECGPEGRMGFKEVEGCSCFINPPCNQCVTNPLVCLKCGWSEDKP